MKRGGGGNERTDIIAESFPNGAAHVFIEPMVPAETSVVISNSATRAEEILGTMLESIPDRYAELRR